MQPTQNQVTPIGISLIIASVICVGSLAGWCMIRGPQERNTLQQMELTGYVRIGYANEEPYGYLDSQTGEITGEAPEIAKHILKKMGATEIEAVVTEFGSLIPGLKAGRFDVIAAGMYITPKRALEIDFSLPTYAIGESFLVRKDNPLNLHSFEDVANQPQATVGVMGGSVEHNYAKTAGIPEHRIIIFPDYLSALASLRTNRVSATACTLLTATTLLRKAKDDQIELADPFHDPVIDGKSTKGYGAFGFRQNDDQFRREFNRQLKKFIGTPEHLELVQPFGFSEKTLPSDMTPQELIDN